LAITNSVRARHRARLAVNLANGSTLAGLGLGLAGRARLARAPDGLITATGYRLSLPAAPAFTMGSVILTRAGKLPPDTALFRHEARHTTQYAWCGGLVMLPPYFAAAAVSWVLCGDFGAWNVFERLAGLADGGYADVPLRPVFARRIRGASARPADFDSAPPRPGEAIRPDQPAAVSGVPGPGPGSAEPARSTATPSL
jgi:hypothetical protein